MIKAWGSLNVSLLCKRIKKKQIHKTSVHAFKMPNVLIQPSILH